MKDYHVLSWDDVENDDATDHGVILDVKDVAWAEKQMWDNDCVEKDGKYYLIFSAKGYDGVFRLGVAVADNPYGPFRYQGVILEPVVGWTTHHSFVEYKGQWYLCYHDCVPSNDITHLRSLKIQRLFYNEDGTIQKVVNE